MIDYARITARAGDGGVGNGSFFRIKGKRYGKANGGDGGRGGDVYLLATRDLNTLESFRYVKDYQAKNGTNGLSRRRRGADGRDLVIKVPVGTLVRGTTGSMGTTSTKGFDHKKARDTRDTFDTRDTLVFDLTQEGQRVLVARGGEGGRGNIHLKDEFGRRPKIGERGKIGEVYHLILELKLIADVGIIGLPNSGKSTLLSALTAAKPKVAPYPFTTLEPNLGVLIAGPVNRFLPASAHSRRNSKLEGLSLGSLRAVGIPSTIATRDQARDTLNSRGTLVLADIPGLIEGASSGRGLGDLFLRHIERTKILIHLIDISTQTDKWQDYQTVRGELKAYSKELVKKKEIIVLNKIDLVAKKEVESTIKIFSQKRKRAFAISAVSGQGLRGLVLQIKPL